MRWHTSFTLYPSSAPSISPFPTCLLNEKKIELTFPCWHPPHVFILLSHLPSSFTNVFFFAEKTATRKIDEENEENKEK